LKHRRLHDNLTRIVAIEAVCAARAHDHRAPLNPAPGTAAARDRLRKSVAEWGHDRELAPDLAVAAELVAGGHLVEAAENAIGRLD
jgi:histidine ammonia-lyase